MMLCSTPINRAYALKLFYSCALALLFIAHSHVIAFAHRDTVLKIEKNGTLKRLPEQYLPSVFDQKLLFLQVGKNRLDFPVCLAKYFEFDREYRLKIMSSWYHDNKNLPPYIKLEISPRNAFQYSLLLELDTLKIINVEIALQHSPNSWSLHLVEIDAACRKSIERNIRRG